MIEVCAVDHVMTYYSTGFQVQSRYDCVKSDGGAIDEHSILDLRNQCHLMGEYLRSWALMVAPVED